MQEYKPVKVEKSVLAFLDRCSNIVATHARDSFNQNVWSEFTDLEIKSPIEQFLYTALKLTAEVNYYDLSDPHEVEGEMYVIGLDIKPQCEIDKYRVDFLVSWYPYPQRSTDGKRRQDVKTVIVECDSQEWHERTEEQRRYEKARDRHFLKAGYKVFHYTGTEILKNPFAIAAEVLAFITGHDRDLVELAVHDIAVNTVEA